MPIENVENMISMNIFNPTKWFNNHYLNLKEYNEYYTKFLKLSNLSINTIDDLAEAVTPPIYYLFSSVRKNFFNEGPVEKSLRTASFSPVFYKYDEVYIFTKIYFYDEPKIGRKKRQGEKWKLNLLLCLMIYLTKKTHFLELKIV